jgi:hypothetical protein
MAESLVNGELNKKFICDLPIKSRMMLEIGLEPKEVGFFAISREYRLHVRVNGQ